MNVTVVPTSATVPWVALPTAVIDSAPPSGSVSLATSAAAVSGSAVSSTVAATSSVATGGSSTAVTLTVTVPVAEASPSDTV